MSNNNIVSLIIAALVVAAIPAIVLGHTSDIGYFVGYVFGRAAVDVGIAVILAGIPAGIYWFFKRKRMPGLNITIWVLWGLVAVLSFLGNLR